MTVRQHRIAACAALLLSLPACGDSATGDPLDSHDSAVSAWPYDAGSGAPLPQAEGGARDAAATFDASAPADAALSADASSTSSDASAQRDASLGDAQITSADGGVVKQTIVVKAGETFDGQGRRYTAGAELGDGSQSEGQKPVFRLENGATLKNVMLGAPAADGIHTYGDVTLENIVWEDIGEDALTIKEQGTVVLNGGSARNGDDKVFQVNAPSTFRLSNFRADSAGKLIRQNGGTSFKVEVFIDRCDISNMKEAIFRTDSKSSTVSMVNSRYSNIGEQLFIGLSAANISVRDNTEY